MPQRVEFAVFPNTPERAILSTVNKILGHVRRNPQMGFKQFREWLREQNLWDKETTPLVLELIGIDTQPKFQWTPLASQLFEAPDESQQQQVLFRRIRDENVLLTKYVLTSIDVDSGGRLHSSHELYRVLTSYVYPGAYVTLPSFQAWIRWMQACDAIRYIGIRWGLGDVGKAAIPWLRSRDDDEILEDMADDDSPRDDGHSLAEVPAMPNSASVPTVVEVSASRSGTIPAKSESDDDLPDMPDEPEPPGEDVATQTATVMDTPDERRAVVRTSGPTVAPVALPVAVTPEPTQKPSPTAPRPPAIVPAVAVPAVNAPGLHRVRLLPAPIDTAAVANTAEWIRAFWVTWPDKKKLDLGDFGFSVSQYDSDRGLFLSRLAYLSLLVTETTQPTLVRGYWDALGKVRFLERTWAQPTLFVDLLAELQFFANHPVHAKLAETLVHALAFQVRIRNNPEWVEMLEQTADGRTLVSSVFDVVYGGVSYLAPFRFVRELVSVGLLDRPEIRAIAVVPTYRVRENSYRLGFIDSLYAESLPTLFSISEAISQHFGPDEGFGDALDSAADHLGCSFNCGRVYVCPLPCREKLGR